MTRLGLALVLVVLAASRSAQAAPHTEYPAIRRLSPHDIVFKQVQDSLAQGYRAEQNAAPFPDLFICGWTASGGEELFAVAARLSLPYETLSTLNGLDRPRALAAGETLLVPSLAGVFVPDVSRNDLDIILAARLSDPEARAQRILVRQNGKDRWFTFYPGARLYPTERSFFLDIGFRMPLPSGLLTSAYGYRTSPVDGHDRMHEGVDLAAPAGTGVLAARDGTVVAAGNDATLGLRIILEHEGGVRTLYGHLSRVDVVLNQTVRSGTMIGAVGSTGLSTGPHLHFEIRLKGKARDPSSYIPGLKP